MRPAADHCRTCGHSLNPRSLQLAILGRPHVASVVHRWEPAAGQHRAVFAFGATREGPCGAELPADVGYDFRGVR